VLSPGQNGTFDDSGIGIGCITEAMAAWRCITWDGILGVRSPWRTRSSCESANAQAPFERFSPGPILDRSPEDPYTLSYPCVLQFGRRIADVVRVKLGAWRRQRRYASRHQISRSRDGSIGHETVRPSLALRPRASTAGASSVVKAGEMLLMCFACRGENYRLGAASSGDGVNWTRLDATMGLGPGQGWESEMTCYPGLFWHRERLWLAYNGNGYGATGFGLAVWQGGLAI